MATRTKLTPEQRALNAYCKQQLDDDRWVGFWRAETGVLLFSDGFTLLDATDNPPTTRPFAPRINKPGSHGFFPAHRAEGEPLGAQRIPDLHAAWMRWADLPERTPLRLACSHRWILSDEFTDDEKSAYILVSADDEEAGGVALNTTQLGLISHDTTRLMALRYDLIEGGAVRVREPKQNGRILGFSMRYTLPKNRWRGATGLDDLECKVCSNERIAAHAGSEAR